jgi:A/G-specific adenine glycosylase
MTAMADAPIQGDWGRVDGSVIHVFTHFRLDLAVFTARFPLSTDAPAGAWWSAPDALPAEALPSVMRKAIEAALPGATRRARRAA